MKFKVMLRHNSGLLHDVEVQATSEEDAMVEAKKVHRYSKAVMCICKDILPEAFGPELPGNVIRVDFLLKKRLA